MVMAQNTAKGGTGGGYLVIYGHFSSYFVAECFMHHVNLYVIRVLVELMLCDEKLGHASVLYWFRLAWFGCHLVALLHIVLLQFSSCMYF